MVFNHCGLGVRDAVLAFGYNRLTGIVSTSLRLMSIGQQQGQLLLAKSIERLPDAADRMALAVAIPFRKADPPGAR
jgi:urease accessory protein UreF